jgi:hypothetical protein
MTIFRKRIMGALPILVFSSTVSASGHGIAVKGGGGISSCAEMLNVPAESIAEYQVRSWILGFISGRNWESISQKGLNIDEDTIFYSVKQYCRENPIDSVFQGANWLYENHLPDL